MKDLKIEWLEKKDVLGYIEDYCKINNKEMFKIFAGAYGYLAFYYDKRYTDYTIIFSFDELKRTARLKYGKEDIETQRLVLREFFLNDYKTRVLTKAVTWTDSLCYTNDCASVCKKGDLTLFRIIRERDAFYTNYSNPSIFTVQRYSYHDAAKWAKESFGEDSLENRLFVVKNKALENYRKQIADLRKELDALEV